MKTLGIFLLAACTLIFACGMIQHTPATAETANAVATTQPTAVSDKASVGTNIGDQAPEIALNNPDGKTMSLSDLRGKYVLIDFWASWCGPCRRENPNVVNAYQKYSNAKFKDGKGFEVFSVSLDRSKGPWVAAIKKDNLTWDYHVSDLQFWNSAAAKEYGVRAIPASFLVNPEGVIVAKNLRGIALHTELDKYVASFKK